MILKIKPNPDRDIYESVTQLVKDNDNYCPCCLLKDESSKCICDEFKNQNHEGLCHCGRYIKIVEE